MSGTAFAPIVPDMSTGSVASRTRAGLGTGTIRPSRT